MNKILIVIIAAIIGFISMYLLGHDNKIEEISEEVIKQHINIEIDLSPNSPEQQNK